MNNTSARRMAGARESGLRSEREREKERKREREREKGGRTTRRRERQEKKRGAPGERGLLVGSEGDGEGRNARERGDRDHPVARRLV